MFGNDIEKAVIGVQKALDTVTTGLIVEINKLSENNYSIRMKNNPHPIEYYRGVYSSAMSYFQVDFEIGEKTYGEGDYEYIVEWK